MFFFLSSRTFDMFLHIRKFFKISRLKKFQNDKKYDPPAYKNKIKKIKSFLIFIIGIVIEFRLIGKVYRPNQIPTPSPLFYTLCTTLIYEKDVM
jgi:hypothetical protein